MYYSNHHILDFTLSLVTLCLGLPLCNQCVLYLHMKSHKVISHKNDLKAKEEKSPDVVSTACRNR